MSRNGNGRTELPDPEVVPVAQRRQFTAKEKLRILEEAEGCKIRQVLMRVEALILLFPANIPATLYQPAEVGWRGSEWEDHASPVLAQVFNKLEWKGLPLPPQLCGVQGGARSRHRAAL